MAELPGRCEVVISGGGIVGRSIAYHLTRLGISDVLLLVRKELTCGTTWHGAGLVGQLRATRNLIELAKYTAERLHELERETGQATGFRQNARSRWPCTPSAPRSEGGPAHRHTPGGDRRPTSPTCAPAP